MSPSRLRLPILVATLCAAAAPAAAQGLVRERYPELGVPTLYLPRTFDVIPLQPDERWARVYLREKPAEERGRGAERRRFRPEVRLVVIPRETEPEEDEELEEHEGTEPAIRDLPSYAEHGMDGWAAARIGPGRKDRTYASSRYELTDPKERAPLVGYAYVWEVESRHIALVGICHQDDYDELGELWERMGEKMKVAEPKASAWADEKLARYYRYKDFSHPEYRIAVRAALVEGWEAEDTENYIVVYNTSDQPLVRKIVRDLELLREEYERLFPPAGAVDAVSTVRICGNRDEYMAYGGVAGSAGYWSSANEELVLYDAEKQERGERPDDSDTFVTLYHEAFHQYIHYSAGELPPHSWFNEGYGDYFSGATIEGGKVRRIGMNPWRVELIKSMVEKNRPCEPVPWKEIVRFSQGRYYMNGGPKYAQGWSMVYFLNRSPEVAKRREWAKILPAYFEELKARYAEELGKLDDPLAPEQRAAAGQKAREHALERAFEGVDFDEIDAAWRDFVLGLEIDE